MTSLSAFPATSIRSATRAALRTAADSMNFYAYFNSYGNNAYDPNDVNFLGDRQHGHRADRRSYSVAFPLVKGSTTDVSYA